MSKSAIIDGNTFSDLSGFYDEVERKLTHGLDWSIGRNLNAFNDVLRGGFGVHDYAEPLDLTWLNSEKSRLDLGREATARHYEAMLATCHPSNIPHVQQQLDELKSGRGQVLFEIILEIIRNPEHDHVTFTLQ